MKRWLIGGLVGIAIAAAAVWYWTDVRVERAAKSGTPYTAVGTPLPEDETTTSSPAAQEASPATVTWSFTGSEWKADGAAPACEEPLVMAAPVELTTVTHILYPGQTRGGNYKPHGGFRFNNSTDNMVSVTAPMDAVVVNGARYLEGGETQYTFDFIASCGIMYRMGHFLELTPKFQAIAETFPPAKEDDSRTTEVNPPVAVTAGEEIATAIGVRTGTNTFVDWGVYDLRQPNGASGLPAEDQQLAPYAVCWFDYLSAADEATVRGLPPGDPESGTTSSYCK
ncbi:hypothetical protein HY374_00865 [Candidatus Berkelbacteria bacterium]|nr:hypothetical protein [Candidatus Berkelbacteria bacterium]